MMSDENSATFHILHNGKTAIFVDKPSGILVHNSHYAGPRERSLRMNVGRELGRRVYPVHRLDRPTSGVMIFAHEKEFVERWQQALRHPNSCKEYIGIVTGTADITPRIIEHHVRVSSNTKKDAITEIVSGLVSIDHSCTLLRFRIHTGRKHQIRQHMKHLRQPLLEDTTYGKGRFNRPFREQYHLSRLALHAYQITLQSPDQDCETTIRAPIPESLTAPFESLFPQGLQASVNKLFDE